MRALGLDLGSKRIGLALSDPETGIAFPAGFLERSGLSRDLAALRELVRDKNVRRIVIGLPLHMDGRTGTGARAAQKFAHALAEATGLPVDTLDERWTSVEAERALRDGGASKKRRKQKGMVDSVAAALILRTYLEQRIAAERRAAISGEGESH